MSRREDMITGLLATWLIVGLFLDGWAHNTRPVLETFFTPWHAVFYSGFAAVALWVLVSVRRRHVEGDTWLAAIPVGYRAAVIGLALFMVSGAGDLAWHVAFGIERNEAALLSPTHLGLFTGGLLIVTAPLRSRWADARLGRSQPWRELGPAILSLGLAGSLTAFILQNFSPIRENIISKAAGQAANILNIGFVTNRSIEHVVASYMLATVFLFAPVLFLARRWDLPAGVVFALVGSQGVLLQGLRGFEDPGLVLLVLISAAATEGLARALRPSPDHLGRLRAFAGLAPAIFWGCFLGGIALHDHGLGYKAEIWGGALVWTSLTTLALTLLMYPPPVPETLSPRSGQD